jgi:hypothetical protein
MAKRLCSSCDLKAIIEILKSLILGPLFPCVKHFRKLTTVPKKMLIKSPDYFVFVEEDNIITIEIALL